MSEQHIIQRQDEQTQQPDEKKVSLTEHATLAGSTLLVGGVLDAFAHGGLPGLAIAGLGSYVAWKHGPELTEGVRKGYAGLDPRIQAAVERWSGGRIGGGAPTNVVDVQEPEEEAPSQNTVSPPEVKPLPQPTPTYDVYVDLDTHMNFGPTLQPHADKVFSGRKVLFGVSDAGKSNNLAVILEEIARFGAPLFLFDTEGEYKSLVDKQYLPKGLHITRDQINHDQGYKFAQWVLTGLRQVVIDLSTYSDSEAAWLMINIIKGVKDFEEAHEVRLPCELLLEEASVWLPQNPGQSTLSKVMVDDPDGETVDDEGSPKPVSLLSLLERSFFSVVVRRGRKRGMGFTLATQRPAELNKSAMSANWIFYMRQTQAVDFKLYKEYGITPEVALSLKQGEAIVFQAGKPLERHQFRKRYSPHGANTPGLAELRQHQQGATAATRTSHQSDRSERREMPVTPPAQEPVELDDDLSRTVLEMISRRYKGEEICSILHLDVQEYREITGYLMKIGKISRRPVPASVPASQADGVPASVPAPIAKKNREEKSALEVGTEAARSGGEVENPVEAGKFQNSPISERELEMGRMFYVDLVGMNVIMKKYYPGVIGGDKFSKGSTEVANALRNYVTYMMRQQGEE